MDATGALGPSAHLLTGAPGCRIRPPGSRRCPQQGPADPSCPSPAAAWPAASGVTLGTAMGSWRESVSRVTTGPTSAPGYTEPAPTTDPTVPGGGSSAGSPPRRGTVAPGRQRWHQSRPGSTVTHLSHLLRTVWGALNPGNRTGNLHQQRPPVPATGSCIPPNLGPAAQGPTRCSCPPMAAPCHGST